ncbi:Holliday junction resolvase RuvX [Candidatus Kinetoplastidibacterium crithidiae]|uniref:Putative pre-16S rRNA nuclease n=1 Tax=Candidatus Kinetoplastidibacterium crithidiae TCC036E TaxID=1208918 RepID=M1LXG9_9PROT|nr:Holliday junction resolvase RuvX [Candidatus Kinetoplastibacterium crithidii]AFZ82904.1 Holliday junction resolvase-like protein [Candidatus Kinetoplastibacterium crithidii (ex Angomonas deanei ATCC 30255)]AGF47904.1 putative holliday junction resolvase [Candidatus Kinetoplastibacterium crithidii TCC036E]
MEKEIVLAFDYGEKKIGVAIGNTFSFTSRPLEIVSNHNKKDCFARLGYLINHWEIKRVIVGLSLDLNGSEQTITASIYRFSNRLKGRFQVAVEFVDESYSSIEAQSLLRNNKHDDAIAAAVILQRYFDALSIQ